MTGAVAVVTSTPTTGSGTVVPGVVDWPDVSGVGAASTGNQTFTGLSTPITLQVDWTGGASLAYSLNGASFASLTSGGSIIVQNTNTLGFALFGAGHSGTVTVTNISDSSTVLDTFTYVVIAVSAPGPP